MGKFQDQLTPPAIACNPAGMTREELIPLLNGGLGLALLILMIIWTVLWFFVPFMIYGIWHRTKRIHEDIYGQLAETIRLIRLQSAPNSPARQESEATRNPFGR